MRHELKIGLSSFTAVIDGRLRHEIRKETDRTFRLDDQLFLREWATDRQEFTGRAIEVGVTHVTRGPDLDLPPGLVVMSLEILSELIEGSYPASQDDPHVTLDLLGLAAVSIPFEVVASWSPEERKQADDWASAHCLVGTGSDEIPVPPIPPHVERFRA